MVCACVTTECPKDTARLRLETALKPERGWARKGTRCHFYTDQGWSPGAVCPKEESAGGRREG